MRMYGDEDYDYMLQSWIEDMYAEHEDDAVDDSPPAEYTGEEIPF